MNSIGEGYTCDKVSKNQGMREKATRIVGIRGGWGWRGSRSGNSAVSGLLDFLTGSRVFILLLCFINYILKKGDCAENRVRYKAKFKKALRL